VTVFESLGTALLASVAALFASLGILLALLTVGAVFSGSFLQPLNIRTDPIVIPRMTDKILRMVHTFQILSLSVLTPSRHINPLPLFEFTSLNCIHSRHLGYKEKI
jgi:hypothetical protein